MRSSHRALAFPLFAIWSQLPAQDPGTAQPATTPGPQAPTQQPAARPKGIQMEVSDFKVKLGGYVKVDLIHDFDEIGSTDSFDPRTIPTDDESNPGVNTRMHARQTRFNLDVRGPTTEGELRVFFEGDFFGDGNTFRIRHAYGTLGGLLAGQTWSTFMDDDCMPETLDFESPIAFPQIRQAQIRYRGEITEAGSYWAVALEDPASRQLPTAVPGEVEEPTPDVCGRLRWAHDRGHCQLGVFVGAARFDPDTQPAEMTVLYGANFSTKLNVIDRDQFYFQGTYGPGVGRYRGGFTAALDSSGSLEPVDVLGFMVAYEHHWSDKWRSTVTYSWGQGEVPTGVATTGVVENLEYAAANLIWQFSERSWAGVEYLYGSREDEDGSFGRANRVQFSVRFDI